MKLWIGLLSTLSLVAPLANAQNIAPGRAQPIEKTTGKIIGRVVYEDGRPAPGVPVLVTMQAKKIYELGRQTPRNRFGGYLANSWFSTIRKTAITGADGRFYVGGLMNAPYNVMVNFVKDGVVLAGPTGFVAAARENIVARNDKTTPAPDLVLETGAVIEGVVKDRETGAPLRGILLVCQGPQRPISGENRITARTDAKGHFSFRVAPGESLVAVNGYHFGDGNKAYVDANNAQVLDENGVMLPILESGFVGQTRLDMASGQTRSLTFSLSKTPAN